MNEKKLGFGLMRLPLLDPNDTTKIDLEAVNGMADRFLAAGFRHFDTAAPYHGGNFSELAFRECVAKRYPRDAYTITDKLSFFIVQKAEELEGFFAGQLERCGVDCFDYYWLHAMNRQRLELAESIGAFDFINEKKAQGKIIHVGLSFHDKAEVLDGILTRHPEMEYVQLQLNYLDWDDPEVQAGACYEVCRKHGKPVMVMEPVKGGLLSSLPPEAEALLKAADPNASPASWAIRFAASLDNVCMVLSGMSTRSQLEDNLRFMSNFKPITADEQRLLAQVVDIIHAKTAVACTACRYCVDGCPQKILIPDIFKYYNRVSKFGPGALPSAKQGYAQLAAQGHGLASACIGCGQCESKCPQNLPIIEHLKETVKLFEA